MTNGRAKGNKFENEVCYSISRWLAPKHTPIEATVYDLPFRRRSTSIMPSEGHWHGQGDILHKPLSDIVSPFAFECKKREGWELDGMFNGDKWPVWAWWRQTEEQADKGGLVPLMIFSRNRRENLVMLYERDSLCLGVTSVKSPCLRIERPRSDRTPPVVVVSLADLVRVPLAKVHRLASRNQAQNQKPRKRARTTTG